MTHTQRLTFVWIAVVALFNITCSAQSITWRGDIFQTAPRGNDSSCSWQSTVIEIGVLYSSVGQLAPYSQSGLVVTQLFLDGVNARCGLGGKGYEARVFGCDISTNPALIAPCVDKIVRRNITFVLLPEGPFAGMVAPLPAAKGLVLVAGMSGTTSVFQTANGKRAYPNVFGVLTPARKYMQQFVALQYIKGARRAAVVSSSPNLKGPDGDVCTGAIKYIKEAGMKLVMSKFIPLATSPANLSRALIMEAMREAKALKPELLITCASQWCSDVFGPGSAMRTLDFNPTAHGLFECLNQFATYPTTLPDAMYASGPIQWHESLRGEEYEDVADRPFANLFPHDDTMTSGQKFMQSYRETSRRITVDGGVVNATSLTAFQLAGCYRFDYAVAVADSLDNTTIINAMQTMNINCMQGLISTGLTGENDNRPIPHLQVISPTGDFEIIYPMLFNPVIPMPTFSERVFEPHVLQSPAENALIVVATLITATAHIIAGILIRHREHPAVKSQSLPFTLILLLGCCMLSWSFATWTPTANDAQCRSMIAVRSLAFACIVGPITVTAHRVHRIIQAKRFALTKRSNWMTFGVMCGFMSIHIMVACVTLINHDLRVEVVAMDPYRPSLNIQECSAQSIATSVTVGILGCASFFALCITSYYAFHIRKIDTASLQTFNNAKLLTVLVFVFVLMLTLGSIIQFALPESADNRGVKFVIRSVLEQVLAISCMILYCFDSLAAVTSMQRISPNMYNTKYDGDGGSTDPGLRISTVAGGNAVAQRSPTGTMVHVTSQGTTDGGNDNARKKEVTPVRPLPPVTRRRSKAGTASGAVVSAHALA
jgi:hypothetical protein